MSFLPMPSIDEISSLLLIYKKVLERYAEVLYVDIDINRKVFAY
jgi:hypothetical protein